MEGCAALVHVWPAAWVHPIEAMGRAVLKRGSKSKEMWIGEAKRIGRDAQAGGLNGLSQVPAISLGMLR